MRDFRRELARRKPRRRFYYRQPKARPAGFPRTVAVYAVKRVEYLFEVAFGHALAAVRNTQLNVMIDGFRPDRYRAGGLLGYSFGITDTDTSVQNDYDGDGKTDVAVWRETDGTFYVLKSTDGDLYAVSWGYSTDSPIASYDTH